MVRCISTTNLKSERALAWVALALGEERRRGAVDLAPRSLRSYCSLRLTIGCCENRVSDLGRSAILGSRTRVLDWQESESEREREGERERESNQTKNHR